MPLFIASAFLTLSATSHAAPPGGGFHGGSFHGGFVAHSAGTAFRMGTGIRRNFAFRPAFAFNQNRRFFENRSSRPSCLFSTVCLACLLVSLHLTITPIWITGRTTTNIGTIRPRLCNRNPPDPPSTMARLSSSSTQATPGPWIQAPILRTSIAATVRPTQQGNKE